MFTIFLSCDIIKVGDKMYEYIKGLVVNQESTYIVLENNNIGYKIHVPNPYSFELGEHKIYIYQHIREDESTLYGFETKEELELFLNLIDVSGIGPKTALPMLATGSVSGIMDAISRENVLYLTKFPKIGEKIAKQIILDLKGKFKLQVEKEYIDSNIELVEVLRGLGYKLNDINKVLPKVNKDIELGEQVKEALKLLLK